MPKLENAPVQSQVGPANAIRKDQQVYLAVVNHYKDDGGASAKALRMMFPTKVEQDRYLAVVFKLLAQNSDILLNCSDISIWDAIDTAATLGLEPGTMDGALIRRGQRCTFMPMYAGYLKRMRHSSQVVEVDTQLVCENDDFSYRLGTDPEIFHTPALEGRGNFTHVYAWALMASGLKIPEVMDMAEINEIRDRYGSKKDGHVIGPWVTNYGEMARKTAIRRLAKRMPQEATQQLLMADAVADSFQSQITETKDDMAELRTLALAATSGPPQTPTPDAQTTPVHAKEGPQGPSGDAK